MNEDRETLDESVRVRMSTRTKNRLLMLVGQNSTMSEYIRRVMEAIANDSADQQTGEFVPQTVDADCDNV